MKRRLLLIILVLLIIIYGTYLSVNHIKSMSKIMLDKKISQLIVLGYSDDEDFTRRLEDVRNRKISGVIFYKRNIKNPTDIKKRLSTLKGSADNNYPLFLMLDQEGGLVSRIDADNGFKHYPTAEKISRTFNLKQTYDIYFNMAKSLHDIGFNFNLAPCVDIKTHKNSIIGRRKRTYGNDHNKVSQYARIFIEAHNSNKVITTLKHYPGIGNATIDSHERLPDTTSTWNKTELKPFENIIKDYPDEPIMVAHVLNQHLDKENPMSISKKGLSYLENTLNHKGVVIIDAVNMAAMEKYTTEQVIIKAINAGVNLFIFPNHSFTYNDDKQYLTAERFYDIVLNAIENGLINQKQINKSYKKIMKLKREYLQDNT